MHSRSPDPWAWEWAQDHPAGKEDSLSPALVDQRWLLARHWGGRRARLGNKELGVYPGLPLDLDARVPRRCIQAHLSHPTSSRSLRSPSPKQHHRGCEPSRTLELILSKPLTELGDVRSEKRGRLPRITWPQGHGQIVTPGTEPRAPLQRFAWTHQAYGSMPRTGRSCLLKPQWKHTTWEEQQRLKLTKALRSGF